ncbi:MAG: hypothetical protein JWQ27_1832 [Ferruginibacter sp.]|nr:hypothetical protein [Ferruginibacter sp.]
MQKVKCFFGILFLVTIIFSFEPAKEKINWISLQELEEQYAKNPRPILVDMYTDWCGWCKQMDRVTYSNDKVAAYINEHYYAVRYNAESRDTAIFNHKKYTFNPGYGTNDLALFLSFGRLEYPCTVFLSTIDAKPAPLPGYMKPKEIEAPLKFFGERADLTQTFVEFSRKMKKEWR